MRYGLWALGLAVMMGGLSSGGCATLISGKTQHMTFQSIPDGATVTVVSHYQNPFGTPDPGTERFVGVTPLATQLDRTVHRKLGVQFSKPGYRTVELPLGVHTNPWWWGNILFGGLGGSVTDMASGASFEYDENKFFVQLQPEDSTPVEGQVLLNLQEQIRLFILKRHADIRFDLSRGFGEDLASLLTLLSVTEPNREATSDRLRTLARTYPDPMVFADHVLHLDVATK